MTRHLHETANAVLYRALDLPAGDRQQFIAQATAGDADLFENVRTMLSRIEQLDQFLEDPLELPVEQKAPVPVLPRHGDLVGDWKVEHEIGRNGADLILAVRRAGSAGTMRLAQSAARGGQTGARFERLRERLATLRHPAIAVPTDAGATADGRPYFVVARPDGVAIDHYCAEHGLDLAARASLFAQVCHAVHYMHQHLIVHRDLKPADMLVAAAGAVHLLEVGMIGDGWPVNPAYASPDQLAGQPLSSSADIYSLGAVLYGLLSGRYAHAVDGSGVFQHAVPLQVLAPSQAVDAARAQSPGTPADMVDDAVLAPSVALAAQLRDHFDAIVLRALALDPAARYPSADALARDLEQAAAQLNAPAPDGLPAGDGAGVDEPAAPLAQRDPLTASGAGTTSLLQRRAGTDDTRAVDGAVDGAIADDGVIAAHARHASPVGQDAAAAAAVAAAAAAAAGAGSAAAFDRGVETGKRNISDAAVVADYPAPRRSLLPLAIALLAAGFVGGVLAGPWLLQQSVMKPVSAALGRGTASVTAPTTMLVAGAPLAGQGNGAKAGKVASKTALPTADSFAAALALADSRRLAGDLAGARQAANDAVGLVATVPQATRDRAGADANARLGVILAELGQSQEGIAALRRALALHEAHAVMDSGGAQAARAAADVHQAIATVHTGSANPAAAETELAAARAVYVAQTKAAPADGILHERLLDIEMALAAAQNAQKHGRDTVTTLAGLRRLAGAAGDARIDLLEAYVQPRGTAEKAYVAAQAALARLHSVAADTQDPEQTRALARAVTMAGEVALRARQTKAACGHFEEAAGMYGSLNGAGLVNAYDKAALAKLTQFQATCR